MVREYERNRDEWSELHSSHSRIPISNEILGKASAEELSQEKVRTIIKTELLWNDNPISRWATLIRNDELLRLSVRMTNSEFAYDQSQAYILSASTRQAII